MWFGQFDRITTFRLHHRHVGRGTGYHLLWLRRQFVEGLLTSYDGQLLASDEIGNLADDGTRFCVLCG